MELGIFVSFSLCTLAFASPAVRKNETIVKKESFRFLGQTRHFSKQCFSRYYLSQYQGSWEDLRDDCENISEGRSSLAAIETEDEFSEMYQLLYSEMGESPPFWVNGRQGPGGRVQWEFNGSKTDFNEQFLKWDDDEPTLDSLRLNRLQMLVRRDTVFRMRLNSELAYAICEAQTCE